jgi:hypothetical protein
MQISCARQQEKLTPSSSIKPWQPRRPKRSGMIVSAEKFLWLLRNMVTLGTPMWSMRSSNVQFRKSSRTWTTVHFSSRESQAMATISSVAGSWRPQTSSRNRTVRVFEGPWALRSALRQAPLGKPHRLNSEDRAIDVRLQSCSSIEVRSRSISRSRK